MIVISIPDTQNGLCTVGMLEGKAFSAYRDNQKVHFSVGDKSYVFSFSLNSKADIALKSINQQLVDFYGNYNQTNQPTKKMI